MADEDINQWMWDRTPEELTLYIGQVEPDSRAGVRAVSVLQAKVLVAQQATALWTKRLVFVTAALIVATVVVTLVAALA